MAVTGHVVTAGRLGVTAITLGGVGMVPSNGIPRTRWNPRIHRGPHRRVETARYGVLLVFYVVTREWENTVYFTVLVVTYSYIGLSIFSNLKNIFISTLQQYKYQLANLGASS